MHSGAHTCKNTFSKYITCMQAHRNFRCRIINLYADVSLYEVWCYVKAGFLLVINKSDVSLYEVWCYVKAGFLLVINKSDVSLYEVWCYVKAGFLLVINRASVCSSRYIYIELNVNILFTDFCHVLILVLDPCM